MNITNRMESTLVANKPSPLAANQPGVMMVSYNGSVTGVCPLRELTGGEDRQESNRLEDAVGGEMWGKTGGKFTNNNLKY